MMVYIYILPYHICFKKARKKFYRALASPDERKPSQHAHMPVNVFIGRNYLAPLEPILNDKCLITFAPPQAW